MKLKTNWHFTKSDGLNIPFVIQHIRSFKNFWGSANILLEVSLKTVKNKEDFESSIFFEAQKYYFIFESRLLFCFFSNGHIYNFVSTLPNVAKIDVKNGNVVSTLSDAVQFNVEIHNFVSTVLNAVSYNVDVHNNVEPTLTCLLGYIYNFITIASSRIPNISFFTYIMIFTLTSIFIFILPLTWIIFCSIKFTFTFGRYMPC